MCKAKYQVRLWDSFYQNWAMIPITCDTREEAIEKACLMSDYYDCGEDGTEEMQVWIECLGGTAWQMVGYAEYDNDYVGEYSYVNGFNFVECFG